MSDNWTPEETEEKIIDAQLTIDALLDMLIDYGDASEYDDVFLRAVHFVEACQALTGKSSWQHVNDRL